ncbi:FecR family protein [Pandoraea communis]|uniref:FecR family protein n=1 Tax=Pandoraea communis TaxID=2508297 RepID=UPI0025A5CD8E|nr:DUF4880 domain-containing protein [Pandoraea communis]MDM8355863.1 DUF4880 domain-containing protein [Pandoraea communis]
MVGTQSDNASEDAGTLDAQAHAWLTRLRSGAATEQDAEQFRAWCARSPLHRKALADVNHEWRTLGQAQAHYASAFPERRAQTAALLRQQASIASRRRFLRGMAVAGTAAGVAAIVYPPLGLWPSAQALAADHRTAIGEQMRVALAQNVDLLLNTGTSVDVRRAATPAGEDRVVLIDGEVAVARKTGARAVEIVAGIGRIVPDEGSVEVRRAGARYCVTCTAGSARLSHDGRTITLAQRDRVWYDDKGVEPGTTVDLDVASAWQRGDLLFRGTPLADAVVEINRYRPGRVMVTNPQLAARRISGQFKVADLDQAIDQIQRIYHAEVTRLPGRIVILG